MIKIIDKQSRNILAEGRTSGMGFAFLKKINENTFKTVQPISPCKDYLNEPVFTENTGFPTKAHGLRYDKVLNIFDDNFYMVIKIMKTKSNGYSNNVNSTFEQDVEKLKNNYKNIQKIINYIEESIGIKNFTKIIECENDNFLVIGSREWTISTIAISLFSLLLRCSFVYTGKESIDEFLKNYNYNNQDQDLLNMALDKLNVIKEKQKLPDQPPFDIEPLKKGYWSPHNIGILYWDLKYYTQPSN